MATSTTIADVLDALVQAATTALPDAQILDGPPVSADLDDDVFVVGFSVDRSSAEGTQDMASLGQSRRESYDVACMSSVWSGDSEMSPLRQRAKTMLDAFQQQLVSDPTLGGLIMLVQFGSEIALEEAQDTTGASATFLFTVRVSAMT